MYICPEKIKCFHCGSTSLDLDYASEWGPETGDINLVFECCDCGKRSEAKAIVFEVEDV